MENCIVNCNYKYSFISMQVGAHDEELVVADLQTQHEFVVIPILMIIHASSRSRAIVLLYSKPFAASLAFLVL